jgi:hypothetical protein
LVAAEASLSAFTSAPSAVTSSFVAEAASSFSTFAAVAVEVAVRKLAAPTEATQTPAIAIKGLMSANHALSKGRRCRRRVGRRRRRLCIGEAPPDLQSPVCNHSVVVLQSSLQSSLQCIGFRRRRRRRRIGRRLRSLRCRRRLIRHLRLARDARDF